MFNQQARQYVLMLIRIRTMLLKCHRNHRSETNIARIITELTRYLNAYVYDNKKMAGFWLAHRTQIAELIPGEGSKSHEILYETFIKLDFEASILNACHAERLSAEQAGSRSNLFSN
jgi:hypothetical protein